MHCRWRPQVHANGNSIGAAATIDVCKLCAAAAAPTMGGVEFQGHMNSRLRSAHVMTAIVALASIAMFRNDVTVGAAAPQAKERSVWDGVYSNAQSQRGEQVYADACAACHAADLTGSQIVPALVGDDFLTKWNGAMAGDLFELIRTTMPQDKPESLTPDQVADVLAFVFKGNKMPSGNTELPPTFDGLKTTRIELAKKR